REWMAESAEVRLFLPLAPQQAQVGEVELMRQERKQALRMELIECDAVRSRAIRADKQRQEMFVDLDGEVAEALLVFRLEVRSTSQAAIQHTARHADMNTVVCQTDVRQ